MREHDVSEALAPFRPAVREWFAAAFTAPTDAQRQGWRAIASGASTLLLAPTGSGKTLAAFLWCIDRLMFEPVPSAGRRCRVLYVSPLKALAVDVERNLRVPIAGVAGTASGRGEAFHLPAVAVRTGDTPAGERARFRRVPADILITTPESLYLLLTSGARDALRSIDTVIVDEIHALVPGKRGAHLMLSLERLQAIGERELQRIGLSATQRPLDEVARFLGGAQSPRRPRPVTIVDAGARKALELRIEVPIESGPAATPGGRASIWTAVHPRLLELVRAHRSTLVFVNSRRIAERMAAALNELSGETLVHAHHGSIARPQREEIEEKLKAGLIRGLVATSSLELGIDMGAVDLVVQIEAPPSVASGMQRIGRAGHQVGAISRGIIFPKYRGDLVACAAAARAMHDGLVESARYPRNPLDVLAQQIVAMVAMEDWTVDDLYAVIRRSAPFAALPRAMFESVLDMIAGRYPSDEFAELRPRVTWDRARGRLTTREGARHVAVINGGTIPDRGLYGVFLLGAEKGAARVGELDEEMVHESRVGDVFVLGASSWRIEEITHDRVIVSAAPGQPGKTPFWKGDAAGRPLELGRLIGALVRELREASPAAALARLTARHDLDRAAAEDLLKYLRDQAAATRVVPDDRSVLVERCRDELGDWRVCVLTPFGGRIHAPWSMAVTARVREARRIDVETMWTDDGFVVRFPETDAAPDAQLLVPAPQEVERLVLEQLGASSLFAARFREIAGRALLLPRRRPGRRAPLWLQRKRASDLLAVASRFGSFPMVLETYRECLQDFFDVPALIETLQLIATRAVEVHVVDSATPSPFAAALLFGYVANYIYDGDAPLPERRAQALAIDQSQLRELLGTAELRGLLDAAAIAGVERELQHLDPQRHVTSSDALHDLLLRIGDLALHEMADRCAGDPGALVAPLVAAGRIVALTVAGEERLVAVEDAVRYRDGGGVPLPSGLPVSLLEAVADARGDLIRRYARTHGPFTTEEIASRFGLDHGAVEPPLGRLRAAGRVLEGEFRPGGTHLEWCDADVLRTIRRRSLARLRHQVEPVDAAALGRFMATWHGVVRRRQGLEALLDVVEALQGTPLVASVLESEVLPARIDEYGPADLDMLVAEGEVVWCGQEAIGERDGRIRLYLTDQLSSLWPPGGTPPDDEFAAAPRERRIIDVLRTQGASFFGPLHDAVGGGYPGETLAALWTLVWRGVVTNDTLHALRGYVHPPARDRRPSARDRAIGAASRSRRAAPPSGQGRWSLVESRLGRRPSPTMWTAAMARQLLARYGIVTREVAAAESIPGGFGPLYSVLRALEEGGRIRRGYFVGAVAATQFALPTALDLLRTVREAPAPPDVVQLAATDPANPYGTLLPWPDADGARAHFQRSAGAVVILVNGALAAYVPRGGRQIAVFLPEEEPTRSASARPLAEKLVDLALRGEGREGGLLITEINGAPAAAHPLARSLIDAGFSASAIGFHVLRGPRRTPA
jgi:ATP-dependent Lhr-like helicase